MWFYRAVALDLDGTLATDDHISAEVLTAIDTAREDRDVLLDTDLVIKRELGRRKITDTAEWSPFRSYATMHLWYAAADFS